MSTTAPITEKTQELPTLRAVKEPFSNMGAIHNTIALFMLLYSLGQPQGKMAGPFTLCFTPDLPWQMANITPR